MVEDYKKKEYMKLNHAEDVFGEKNLLQSELEILSILKRYQTYKKLRKEELKLKALLKKTINDTREEISKVDKLLPKTKDDKFSSVDLSHAQKARKDLEGEIEEIKRRIMALQEY